MTYLYGSNYDDLLGTIDCGFIGFEREDSSRVTMATVYRIITLFALLLNLAMALINSPVINLAVYLTNWAMLLSISLTLMVLKCSFDSRISEKKGWLAATHIVFELATVLNVVVVSVYWPTIHFKVIQDYEDQLLHWLHQHLVHIFPCTAVLVIFLTTDLRIKAGHAKIFPVVAILFGSVNCYHVKKTGVPTYWFLTWEDHTSPIIILCVCSIVTAWFVGLAKLTATLKCTAKSN